MADFVAFMEEIPVVCLLGLIWGAALMLLPIAQWIDYKLTCKKYGKEEADEMFRRM